MFKKMMVALAALLMSSAVLVGITSPPAQAANFSTPWSCVNTNGAGYAITTCNSVEWSKQADGDGVRLEGMRFWTSNGCGELEDNGGKYNPVDVYLFRADGGLDYQYFFGGEGCTFYKDVSNAIGDTGWAEVRQFLHARINYAGDRDIHFTWHINSAGDYTMISKGS